LIDVPPFWTAAKVQNYGESLLSAAGGFRAGYPMVIYNFGLI